MFKKRKENLSSYVQVLHKTSHIRRFLHRSRVKSMLRKCVIHKQSNLVPKALHLASRKNPGCGWSRGNV